MLNLFLLLLDKTINPLLRSDPATIKKIQNLTGRKIQVVVTDWDLSFQIQINSHGFQLVNKHQVQASDCEFKGKLLDLCQIFLQQATTTSLFKHQIEIIGEAEIAEEVREILLGLNIDWEDLIAARLGDTASYILSSKLAKLRRYIKVSTKEFEQNLIEYLQAETNLLPSSKIINDFYERVTDLRYDVDRLEARLERLIVSVQD